MKFRSKRNIIGSKRKKQRAVILSVILMLVLIWLNNTNIFYSKEENNKFVAHRGLAQTFDVFIPKTKEKGVKYLMNNSLEKNIADKYGAYSSF